MNKSQSWVNFFALSLSNPTPIISFARKNYYLDKILFCHFIQYCKSKPSTIIPKVQKVAANTTGIKYKLRIQLPKSIKNKINLHKGNGNNLWKEAIKKGLKQPTNYQKFIVLDSEKTIPTGYQKIPYHMVFDVKYDLRYNARLVVEGNWTVNEKEDIYSGVLRMNSLRMGFFLGGSYRLPVLHVILGMPFCM
jgi:hypothetical protein